MCKRSFAVVFEELSLVHIYVPGNVPERNEKGERDGGGKILYSKVRREQFPFCFININILPVSDEKLQKL